MSYFVRTIIVTLCLLCLQSAGAQSGSIAKLEGELAVIDSTETILRGQKTAIDTEIEKNNNSIRELKERGAAGYFQQQKLEGLLKNSQSLSQQSEKLQYRLAGLLREGGRITEQLVTSYDAEINRQATILQSDTTSALVRKNSMTRLDDLRRRRSQLAVRNRQSQTLRELRAIVIDDDDTPLQIRQKADLLLDQSDKLRKHADELEDQKKRLKKELDLRYRISDFVTDLSVFDQQEEVLSGSRPATSTAQDNVDFTGEAALAPDDLRGAGSTFDNLIINPNNHDYTNLTSDDLETVIETIATHQNRLITRSDSLKTQAKKFNKSAQEQE